MSSELTINVADRVHVTEAEGPGRRYALWVQGCPLRCPGCCNLHMLEFREVERIAVSDLADEIMAAAATAGVEGVTFLGGEPFSQAEALGSLARAVRNAGLSVMVFSGFTLEQLRKRADAALLLEETDLLVDGPYVKEQAVTNRRWIGSANQRTHFLTDRCQALADTKTGWDESPNTVELRVIDGRIQVNGFPSPELEQFLRELELDKEQRQQKSRQQKGDRPRSPSCRRIWNREF